MPFPYVLAILAAVLLAGAVVAVVRARSRYEWVDADAADTEDSAR